jgi:rsbT co-antagonist protein RsbR
MMTNGKNAKIRKRSHGALAVPGSTAALLRELVAHLRENRTQLREEWVRRITESKLLTAMTREEIFAEATSVYDNYVEVLESGSVEALQAYARNLSERIIPRGVETHEVLGIVLLLRDVLARSLFKKYQAEFAILNAVLDAYEPAANRIANTVAVGFVQERERIIRQQQEAIRELSTPVLQVRDRLLILPIIGVIDPQRARQLTEQLLRGIRSNRAKVVVVDITGVPSVDATVANHRHRALLGDRPDAGHHRGGPLQDQRRGRPPGRHRGGGEAAGLQGDPGRRGPRGREPGLRRPMRVPILKQGDTLIASIQSALSDEDLLQLRDDLVEQVGRYRSKGAIVDVTVLDVMDSFAVRTLRNIAHMIRLRGAETVIVGIQPEVAFAMVQLGLTLEDVATVLDLEEGLAYLGRVTQTRAPHGK